MMGGNFNAPFGGFWLGGLFGMLINVALIVGVVLLVVWAVQRVGRSNRPSNGTGSAGPGPASSAREILDTRYARGEISREEYQTMLDDISHYQEIP